MVSSIKPLIITPSEGKHGVIMIIILKVLMIFSLPLNNPPKLSDITGASSLFTLTASGSLSLLIKQLLDSPSGWHPQQGLLIY
jgi:hypothetical protein